MIPSDDRIPASESAENAPVAAIPRWTIAAPLLGLGALFLDASTSVWLGSVVAMILMGAVLAGVHHAEIIAHHLGEPFGTLVLAVAVTVIETSLIISMILSDGHGEAALARDTVFAAVMIVMNGIIGACLLAGGRRHHEQQFTQYGVSAGLAMLATLSVLTLVLPNYTTSARGPYYTSEQLLFVALVSLVIYATYVVTQTVRHREYFLHGEPGLHDAPESGHAPLSRPIILASAGLLMIALIGVVLLAKGLSPLITAGVAAAGAPPAAVGIVIAALVLLPEGLAAWRAARRNQLQTSLNLALGSALATIGLTIPAVTVAAMLLDLKLVLGLAPISVVLLVLTLFVASLSLGTGRTTIAQGVLHLVLMATFLFTTLMP